MQLDLNEATTRLTVTDAHHDLVDHLALVVFDLLRFAASQRVTRHVGSVHPIADKAIESTAADILLAGSFRNDRAFELCKGNVVVLRRFAERLERVDELVGADDRFDHSEHRQTLGVQDGTIEVGVSLGVKVGERRCLHRLEHLVPGHFSTELVAATRAAGA